MSALWRRPLPSWRSSRLRLRRQLRNLSIGRFHDERRLTESLVEPRAVTSKRTDGVFRLLAGPLVLRDFLGELFVCQISSAANCAGRCIAMPRAASLVHTPSISGSPHGVFGAVQLTFAGSAGFAAPGPFAAGLAGAALAAVAGAYPTTGTTASTTNATTDGSLEVSIPLLISRLLPVGSHSSKHRCLLVGIRSRIAWVDRAVAGGTTDSTRRSVSPCQYQSVPSVPSSSKPR